jgi:uncharacterized integral membrane protein
MTQPTTAPHRTTSTLPPPAASGSTRSPPAPPAAGRTPLQTRLTGMRTALIAAAVALTVAVIFIIQNVHAADISFLGVHLVLPLAGALLLAAIAGSLLTVAAGPARISRLRQIMERGLRKARVGMAAPDDRRRPAARATRRPGPDAPSAASDVTPGSAAPASSRD